MRYCLLQAVVLADFASEMNLGGCAGYSSTCETGKTCGLYVMLVLYKVDDEIKCDYLRFWSPASASAAFHHKGLHIVRQHLDGTLDGVRRVRDLKRLRVWSDGDKKAYKVNLA